MSEVGIDRPSKSAGLQAPGGLRAEFCQWNELQQEQHLTRFEMLRAYAGRIGEEKDAIRQTGWPWPVENLDQWSRRFEYPWVLTILLGVEGEVLDAGAGINPLDYCLADQGRPVTVCDLDRRVEVISRRLNAVFGTGVRADCASLDELPYEDGRFEAVFSVSVLEHLDRPEKAVREMVRVLKPGGQLILTLDVEHRKQSGLKDAERLLSAIAVELGQPVPRLPQVTAETVTVRWHYDHDPARLWFKKTWLNRLRFKMGRIPDLAVMSISGTKAAAATREK